MVLRHLRWFGQLALLLVLLSACGAPQTAVPSGANDPAPATASGAPTQLSVFAAASLSEAFTEIGRSFEAANPGVTVAFNFAGSQQLAQQISQGAPADLFASANQQQLDVAVKAGSITAGSARIFARNRLVVVYPKDNPAGLNNLKDLAKPGLKLVLAAKEVPAGAYSLEFLAKAAKLPEYTAAYSASVLANVVSYEQNVKGVLSKVALGEADAGIVYTSDLAGDAASKLGRIDIPDQLNTVVAYPIAPISQSKRAELAAQFIAYLLSPAGQSILVKHGLIAINQ